MMTFKERVQSELEAYKRVLENVEIVGDIHYDLDIYSDLICAIGDKDD